MINAENVAGSTRLNEVINDINLVPISVKKRVNAYFEDAHAMSFAIYLLKRFCETNLDNYISFIDVNLGWTNYLQLYKKGIPEFRNSVLTLDADVPTNRDFSKERDVVENSNNIIFLPIEVEKGLFEFLKDHSNYKKFEAEYSNLPTLTYDICFNDWPLETSSYKIGEIKKWYEYMVNLLGGPEILFKCWLDANEERAKEYAKSFIGVYNQLSDLFELDQIKDID